MSEYWQLRITDKFGYATMWMGSDGHIQMFSRLLSDDPRKVGAIAEGTDSNIIFSSIPNHRIRWEHLGAFPIHMLMLYTVILRLHLQIEFDGSDSVTGSSTP